MGIDVTIKIGGEAGQGIQTVGQLLALACRQAGLYIMGMNDFESRIRGGHSFFQLRISDSPVHAPHHRTHLLVCMNERTYTTHKTEVVPDGLSLINRDSVDSNGTKLSISFMDLAKKTGGPITANTVAAGAVLALLGCPLEILQDILKKQFSSKGPKVTDQNLLAAQLGHEAVQNCTFTYAFDWNGARSGGMLIEGSQSVALGALAGDCRFVSFYPMSPATSIMIHLASYQDAAPLVVEQAEDEIAAVNMIIGAAVAGARSLTATSGGGFCLMAEGLGYAGIAETPIVIINAQRPGPATGLATRTGQGDLQFVMHAGQDDFPRFIFAPGSPAEAYEVTARALDLAEKYQVPVIILVDQYFNDSLYILDKGFNVPEAVPRHIVDPAAQQNEQEYRRYAVTDSGISPMALPCRSKALVMTSGNEHLEDGHLTEIAQVRAAMVDKRGRKQVQMLDDVRPPAVLHPDAAVKVIGWGSTRGAVQEAVEMLRADDIDAGAVHFCDIWPFPAKAALDVLGEADHLFIVEQNSTGQFARLLRQETGLVPSGNILKYDGRPFYPFEIFSTISTTVR